MNTDKHGWKGWWAFCIKRLLPLPLLLAFPTTVNAQFDYTTVNGTITVTLYTGPGGEVTLPDTIDGLPVTSIGDWAFENCTNLTGVTFPNSVTNIGTETFWGCLGLQSVTLPDSVAVLGTRAFGHCTNLTSITLPNSLVSIGDWAFQRCSSLPTIALPHSLTSIGDHAFYRCTGLTNVVLPASVTTIGQGPFGYCTSLLAITVDPLNPFYCSVDGVLYDKNQTRLVQYPDAKMGHYTVPDGITVLGGSAFSYCFGLTSVTLPASLTNIETMAFEASADQTPVRTNFTVAWFQGNAPNAETNAFDGDPNLMIYFCAGTSGWGLSFGGRPTALWDPNVPYAYVTTNSTIALQRYIGLDPEVTLPASLNGLPVTSILDGAFSGYDSLTSVTFGASISTIGNWAFSDCASLSGVYFRGNAPDVGSSVFDNDNAVVFYLPGTTGWGTTFGGRPTMPWVPRVQTSDGAFGVQTNQFGFSVKGPGNLTVIVEAATNPAHPAWLPLQTNAAASGSFYFSDPGWRHYPARFYRLRWQ